MKIGIVGLGVVGSALRYGFEKIGHKIYIHDIRYNTYIEDVQDAELVFVCVPTPSMADGKCDSRIVEEVVSDLDAINYNGVIAIKSTVEPGTTDRLQKKFFDRIICFVPEFLRERCAITDFVENHDLCVIGTCDEEVFRLVAASHGNLPKKVICVSPIESELVKYFNNVYNAMLITFANNFYEVCKKLEVNYTSVKNAVVGRDHIVDKYLDCNENFRGFGGVCLPKDLKALIWLVNEKGVEANLFKIILDENKKYKTTVFEGMRRE